MKVGDTVKINLVGGKSIVTNCLYICNGRCHLGSSDRRILVGNMWELMNDGTIEIIDK